MAAAATTTTGSKGVGVPIKLFKEAESHPVTVELKSGEVYRGTLEESEDSMSCLLKNVHHTGRDGRVMRLEAVYLRGSQIRFIVLPEVLKGAPLFQCVFFLLVGVGVAWRRQGSHYSCSSNVQRCFMVAHGSTPLRLLFFSKAVWCLHTSLWWSPLLCTPSNYGFLTPNKSLAPYLCFY
jgi:small nuclear ribonucleoprotein D3